MPRFFGKKQKVELETATEETISALQLIALDMEQTRAKLADLIEGLKKESVRKELENGK